VPAYGALRTVGFGRTQRKYQPSWPRPSCALREAKSPSGAISLRFCSFGYRPAVLASGGALGESISIR